MTGSERSETAYVAVPAARVRATVVVLHASWGLTAVETRVCDDLADLGYVAVAPDLYRGEVASTVDEAQELRRRKRPSPMWRTIVEALEAARSEYGGEPTGQIGFSMGGHWALWLAKQSQREIPPIEATVVFYATRGGDYSASRSAFQFHLAEADPFVSPDSVTRLQRQLRIAGRHAEFHSYAGTGHWFFERDRPAAYDPEASRLAWHRTRAFLDSHLAR